MSHLLTAESHQGKRNIERKGSTRGGTREWALCMLYFTKNQCNICMVLLRWQQHKVLLVQQKRV